MFAQPGTNNVWSGGGGRIVRSTNGETTGLLLRQPTLMHTIIRLKCLIHKPVIRVGGNLNAGVGYCVKTTNGGVNGQILVF
ncbi:MAG: hypothetical protein R2942_16895 [Ignavibacteria bacterium]